MGGSEGRLFGYVRMPRVDTEAARELEAGLDRWARRKRYELVRMFTDGGIASVDLERPAFGCLVDALWADQRVYGVLVPGSHHLSWHPEILDIAVKLITETGAELLVMNPHAGPPVPGLG